MLAPTTSGWARWSQLNKLEKRILKGHIGPDWLPQWFCNSFANKFDEYYDMKTQAHHDLGYLVGGDEAFRKFCDEKLKVQLYQDITNLPAGKKPMGEYVADVMVLTVRLFGWSAFVKRDLAPRIVPCPVHFQGEYRQ